MKKRVKVVGALIWNDKNEFLICQRSPEKKRGLLWEFVGGKVETNETNEEALKRECKEELNADINVNSLFSKTDFNYPDINIELIIYNCNLVSKDFSLLEHKDAKWITPSLINKFSFCPADEPVLKLIKKNSRKA